MFVLVMQGCRGQSPLQKKKRCHPKGTSADVWCPKDLVTTELFLGRHGACTVEFDVNNRITKVKQICSHVLKST